MQLSQSIKDLEKTWYKTLEDNGFEDIEDHRYPEKPLKMWTGISIEVHEMGEWANIWVDGVMYQEPLTDMKSSFPEGILCKEEMLLNNPSFQMVCQSICRHGNHTLTTQDVTQIWVEYIEGLSLRKIAKKVGIDHVLVFRTIKSLTNWSNIFGALDSD